MKNMMKKTGLLLAVMEVVRTYAASAEMFEEEAGVLEAPVLGVPSGLLLMLVLVALVIAALVVNGMKSQLKTAKKEQLASDYIQNETLDMRIRRDQFLYQRVSRRHIQPPQPK